LGAMLTKAIPFFLTHLYGDCIEHTLKRLRECVCVCDFCKCSDLGVKISESYKLGLYSAGLVVIKSV